DLVRDAKVGRFLVEPLALGALADHDIAQMRELAAERGNAPQHRVEPLAADEPPDAEEYRAGGVAERGFQLTRAGVDSGTRQRLGGGRIDDRGRSRHAKGANGQSGGRPAVRQHAYRPGEVAPPPLWQCAVQRHDHLETVGDDVVLDAGVAAGATPEMRRGIPDADDDAAFREVRPEIADGRLRMLLERQKERAGVQLSDRRNPVAKPPTESS